MSSGKVSVEQFVEAAGAGDTDIVAQGIAQKINLRATAKSGYFALSYAVSNDQPLVVRQLLEARADVTPHVLEWPAMSPKSCTLEIIELLAGAPSSKSLELFASVYPSSFTVLHTISNCSHNYATEKMQIQTATAFLRGGAFKCLFHVDRDGRTPADVAEHFKRPVFAAFLRECMQKQAADFSFPAKSESAADSASGDSSEELKKAKQEWQELMGAHAKLKESYAAAIAEIEGLKQTVMQLKGKMSTQEEKRHFSEMKDEDLLYTEADKLGEGMAGVVYRARYNGADIAVKFVRSGGAGDDEGAAFKHEIMIMQTTPPHPNVVGFLGASITTKPQLLALTLMRGSIEQLVLENGEYPLDFTGARTDKKIASDTLSNLRHLVWFLVGAAAGLAHMHANRVLHCDVAARNLLVDHNHSCHVCDFGMSQVLPPGAQSFTSSKATPLPIAWVAPETLMDHVWSEKSDVYSFGITMFELMSRREPYPGLNLIREVVPGVCKAKDPLRPTVQPWWPDQLVEIAMDCISFRPANRLTMMTVNEKLRRFHKKLTTAHTLADVYTPHQPHSDSAASSETDAFTQSTQTAYKRVPASHYYLSTSPSPSPSSP